MERQALNVFRMRLLGAEVRPGVVRQPHAQGRRQRGHARLGGHRRDDPLLLGSVMGPHPYPWMVRELHRVIGDEAREQCRALLGRDPDVVTACVGGGSNAIGLFSGFAELPGVELVGVEPAGGAAVGHGVPGIVHGSKSFLLQDEHGQVRGGRVDLGRPRLPGRRPRARPPRRHRPGPLRAGHRRRGARRLPAALPAPRASSPPSSRPTRWPGCCGPRTSWPARSCCSTCPGGATRTSPRWPTSSGRAPSG